MDTVNPTCHSSNILLNYLLQLPFRFTILMYKIIFLLFNYIYDYLLFSF